VAGQEKTTRSLPIKTGALPSDRVVFVANAASNNSVTSSISISDMFANTANLSANLVNLRVVSSLGTPANSTSTNVAAGSMWTDGNYIYFATSNNFVKRVAGLVF
jgi:hypothetical protein